MPADLAILEKHKAGKKFLHASQWYSHDFSKYKAHYIVPGRENKTMYCQVTKQSLNRIPAEIERHIAGKRYKAALVEYLDALARTKAANARRDEKARLAASNGWKSHRAHESDAEEVEETPEAVEETDMGLLSKIETREKQHVKPSHIDDLSDLYPQPRMEQDVGLHFFDDEEISEDMDEVEGDFGEEEEELDVDALIGEVDVGEEDSDGGVPKLVSVNDKRHKRSKQFPDSSDSEPPTGTKKRKDKKYSKYHKESTEDELKPKHKSMKEKAKDMRGKREKNDHKRKK